MRNKNKHTPSNHTNMTRQVFFQVLIFFWNKNKQFKTADDLCRRCLRYIQTSASEAPPKKYSWQQSNQMEPYTTNMQSQLKMHCHTAPGTLKKSACFSIAVHWPGSWHLSTFLRFFGPICSLLTSKKNAVMGHTCPLPKQFLSIYKWKCLIFHLV